MRETEDGSAPPAVGISCLMMHDVTLDGLAHLLRSPILWSPLTCRCAAIPNYEAVWFIEVFRSDVCDGVFAVRCFYPRAHGLIGIMQFAGFSGHLTGKLCR